MKFQIPKLPQLKLETRRLKMETDYGRARGGIGRHARLRIWFRKD
jgi:hypothetical protein